MRAERDREGETMGPIIFSTTKNSHTLTPFFEHCKIIRKPVTFFQQDSITSHNTNDTMYLFIECL